MNRILLNAAILLAALTFATLYAWAVHAQPTLVHHAETDTITIIPEGTNLIDVFPQATGVTWIGPRAARKLIRRLGAEQDPEVRAFVEDWLNPCVNYHDEEVGQSCRQALMRRAATQSPPLP